MSLQRSARVAAGLGLAAGLFLTAGCGGSGKMDDGVVVTTEPEKPGTSAPAGGGEPAPAPSGGGAAETKPAEAAPAATAASGWGTLKGRVTFQGDAPAPEVLVAKGDASVKDAAVCATNGINSEKLVVDPESKGVRWAIVYLPKPSAVNEEAKSEALSRTVVFDQKGCQFEPHALAAMQGAKVTIKSSDQASHNVHTQLRGTPFNQGIQPGSSVPVEIKSPDNRPAPVVCDIHPWMKAWWLTLNNPYFAVTNAKGEYEIKNVPAGDQKVVVWTEAANLLTPASGETVAVKADGTTEKDFTLDASRLK